MSGGLTEARQAARALLAWYRWDDPAPAPLHELAWDQGLEVVEGPLEGASARLCVRNDRGVVRLCQDQSAERRRFSLAHELGHWLLHQRWLMPTPGAAGPTPLDRQHPELEPEANAFAAELLLPERWLRPYARDRPAAAQARALAERFQISLTAALAALVSHTEWPIALAVIEPPRIRSFALSRSWPHRLRPAGSPLSGRSAAAQAFRDGRDRSGCRVPADAWIAGPAGAADLELREDCLVQRAYRRVLSILEPG